MKKIVIILLLFITISAVGLFFLNNQTERINEGEIPRTTLDSKSDESVDFSNEPALSILAENLTVPWAMDFLPDGRMIFTQRPGMVNLIDSDAYNTQIAQIDVLATSESGLHGVAVDPDFTTNNNIFLYYTYRSSGNNTLNRVSKYVLENNSLVDEEIIVDEIPGAPNHDGGRIKFGPDGYLYITTGDAQVPSRSQDTNSLAGKILRVQKDGTPAPNNPFDNRIYSYGHRNPQGITWDDKGRLWETEHGRSGALSGLDELNLIEIGGNYGWPEIQGDETEGEMKTPVSHSGASTTWAPAGITYLENSLYFTGLRGQSLYEYKINEDRIVEHFVRQFGRLRDVIVGPDGFLYVAVSNRDGRGNPDSTDDKILKINPTKLEEN